MEAAWYVLPSCSFWGNGSALGWWSVCKGSLPEGDGLRVGEKRCLTVVGKHKENRGLAVKKRQVAKSGLAVLPLSIKPMMDSQPRVMPLGWKSGRRAPLWSEDRKWQG